MPMGGGRGIHDGGFRLYPGSDHCPAHGTGGKTNTRMTAYPFDLPRIREGVDVQDAILFSKPYRDLDGCPISFDTLQVKISLTRKGSEVGARHGHTFMLDPMGMSRGHIIPGIQRPPVLHTGEPRYVINTPEPSTRL